MTWNVKRGPADIQLNGVDMMLLRGKNGELVWTEEPVPFVPERLLDTDLRYANLPPDEAGTYAMTRFDGGIGRRIQPEDEVRALGSFAFRQLVLAGEMYYLYPADVTGDGALINAPLVTSIALGVTGAVADFYELGTTLHALVGQYDLAKGVGDTFSTSKDFGTGQVAKAADTFAGTQATEYAFVALGSQGAAGKLWVFDGATWTQHATKYADYFRRYRSELWRAFFDAGSNGWTVEKTANGGTGSTWAGTTLIGDGGGSITALEVLSDQLFVARTDGLYDVTKDTTPDDADLMGGFTKARRNANNGVKSFAWKDYLFYPTNDGGLYCRMSDGTTFEMGISNIRENRSPIRGRCTALAGDDNWLYATWFNPLTNESYLCKALVSDYAQSNNRPSFVWIGAIVVWTGGVTIGAMKVTGAFGTQPALAMGRSDSRIDYFFLPRHGSDPKQDAADGGLCRARANSVAYFPEVTAHFVNQSKDWESDGAEVENTSTGARYVDEEYRTSPSGGWSSLGRFETDGQAAIDFGSVSGRRLQRRLTLATNDATQFVAVRSLTLSYVLRFPDKARFTFTVDATRDADRLAGGGLQRTDPEDVVAAIRDAKAAAGAVTLVTPYGTQYEVHVRSWKRINLTAESGRPFGWAVQVMATNKAVTGDLALYDVSAYDDGSVLG